MCVTNKFIRFYIYLFIFMWGLLYSDGTQGIISSFMDIKYKQFAQFKYIMQAISHIFHLFQCSTFFNTCFEWFKLKLKF